MISPLLARKSEVHLRHVCRELRYHRRPCFPELAFFDVHEGTERGGSGSGGGSLSNRAEAEFASVLYKGAQKCGSYLDNGRQRRMAAVPEAWISGLSLDGGQALHRKSDGTGSILRDHISIRKAKSVKEDDSQG